MNDQTTPDTSKTTDAGKKGLYALIATGLLILLGALGVEIPVEINNEMTANGIYVLAGLGGAVFARFFYKGQKESADADPQP